MSLDVSQVFAPKGTGHYPITAIIECPKSFCCFTEAYNSNRTTSVYTCNFRDSYTFFGSSYLDCVNGAIFAVGNCILTADTRIVRMPKQ